MRTLINNARLLLSIFIALAFTTAYGQSIHISEIMADNSAVLLDEDGNSPDWVELYNSSTNAINLSGWHLTDNTNNLTQWTFPATNIPPYGFLVIFASDKDRAVSGAELHTNFKLSADGEYIALVQPDGTTVEDELDFYALEEDTAYGYALQ